MEKYFIIKSQSIIDEWNRYNEELDNQINTFKEFKAEHGIEAHEFYLTDTFLEIVPTQNDFKKFKPQFTKTPSKFGLYKFKNTSEIGKLWKITGKSKQIKSCHKPILMWSLKGANLGGRSSQNMFEIDGILYGHLELDYDYTLEDGQVEEMKASEYYRIIEEYNEKVRG